jgi:hypothetical protein
LARKKSSPKNLPSLFGGTEETKADAISPEWGIFSSKPIKPKPPFSRVVQAEFSSFMIGYSKFVLQLPEDIKESFLPYIKNVTSAVQFPIDEATAKNGDKYLQSIFDDLLKKHGYTSSL